MQHKNNSEVDVAKDSASRRRILRKILENLDEWNLRISTVDIKLMHHQLSASSSASEWLDAAAGAIVDIFKLSDEHEDDSGKVAKKAKKFNSIWIIPYLVRNLKFLQSRVLKVSCQILECGNIFKPATKPGKQQSGNNKEQTKDQQTKCSAGHQPFLQLVLTCLRELDNSGADSKKQDREDGHYKEYENQAPKHRRHCFKKAFTSSPSSTRGSWMTSTRWTRRPWERDPTERWPGAPTRRRAPCGGKSRRATTVRPHRR